MGDRANVFVIDNYASISEEYSGTYLYTHWTGYKLPDTLANSLGRTQRWNDGPYLTRIIFCDMIAGDENSMTGYGISASLGDNSYPILVVDPSKQLVRMVREGYERSRSGPEGLLGSWSFTEFASLRPGWPENY